MVGIYKITNLVGKIYVGQSINIERRKQEYSKVNKKIRFQYKLYNSIIKYGWENHTFEILEECFIDELNEKERYWQDYYNVLGDNGLNCKNTNTNSKSGNLSKSTCIKISKRKKGMLFSKEHRNNLSKAGMNRKFVNETIEKLRKTSLCKKVYQYDKDDKYICEWNSTHDASRNLNLAQSSICKCCNNKLKLCGGYKFSYYKNS